MTTVVAPSVSPAALAAVLGNDKVLIAARQMIDAELRMQRLRAVPNEDTAVNGQPLKRAQHLAALDASRAQEALSEAARRAAQRIAREDER